MIRVQYARCWPCQFGDHYDPPKVHTWMDDEDAVAAKVPWPMSDEDHLESLRSRLLPGAAGSSTENGEPGGR